MADNVVAGFGTLLDASQRRIRYPARHPAPTVQCTVVARVRRLRVRNLVGGEEGSDLLLLDSELMRWIASVTPAERADGGPVLSSRWTRP